MRTIWPRPRASSATASRRRASSPSRPTVGVRAPEWSAGRAWRSRHARWTGATLDRKRLALLEHEPALEQLRGAVADEHGPRLGGRLEPCGDVGRIPERDCLWCRHADRPDRRGTRVDPHADVEAFDPPRRPDVLAVGADDLDDAKSRTRGAFRVVGVCRRDGEVRADAVALVRLNRPTELFNGAADVGDTFADECLHLFRQQAFAERGRPYDVYEERGDRTELVLHGPILAQSRPCF